MCFNKIKTSRLEYEFIMYWERSKKTSFQIEHFIVIQNAGCCSLYYFCPSRTLATQKVDLNLFILSLICVLYFPWRGPVRVEIYWNNLNFFKCWSVSTIINQYFSNSNADTRFDIVTAAVAQRPQTDKELRAQLQAFHLESITWHLRVAGLKCFLMTNFSDYFWI